MEINDRAINLFDSIIATSLARQFWHKYDRHMQILQTQ